MPTCYSSTLIIGFLTIHSLLPKDTEEVSYIQTVVEETVRLTSSGFLHVTGLVCDTQGRQFDDEF